MVNDQGLIQRAEIIREKGTDRSRFFRGEIDKYTWQEAGSSFLPGEVIAAFLWAQLEEAEAITAKRMTCWNKYDELLVPLEEAGVLRRPVIPAHCRHNAHMYYILLAPEIDRQKILNNLKQHQIFPVFHYVPLHSSPGGKHYGRTQGTLKVTDERAERLLRLPLWIGLSAEQQEMIVQLIADAIPQSI